MAQLISIERLPLARVCDDVMALLDAHAAPWGALTLFATGRPKVLAVLDTPAPASLQRALRDDGCTPHRVHDEHGRIRMHARWRDALITWPAPECVP